MAEDILAPTVKTNSLPNKRSIAMAIGSVRYFTGVACKRGHVAERYSVDGACAECVKEKLRRRDKWKVAEDARARRAKNPSSAKAAKAKYQKNNYQRFRDLENTLRRDRYRSDPVYRIGCIARAMLNRALKMTGGKKDGSTNSILGYSKQQLSTHIERQLVRGMSMDKIGREVEIDHIIPISEFVRLGIVDMSVINALSNLRPMFSDKNRKKGAKVFNLL